MRYQKPLRNGRTRKRIYGHVIKEINSRLEQEANRFNVSKSFVQSVALADYFKIKNVEGY